MSTLEKTDTFVEIELKKFEYTNESLSVKAESYKNLFINDVEDKQGYEAVDRARKDLKFTRVDIEKKGKSLRESANTFIKAVLGRERELIDIVSTTEDSLQKKQDVIDSERSLIKEEAIRKESERVQSRINKLSAFGYGIDYLYAKSITDDAFEKLLSQSELEYNEKQEELRRERLAEEQKKELERIALRAELEKLQSERLEFEKKRNEQLQRDADIKAEQDKITRALQDERNKLEAEKKAIENARVKAEQERLKQIELENVRLVTIENARLKAIEDATREEFDKIQRQLLRPDKVNLQDFANELKAITPPILATAKAINISADAIALITKAFQLIETQLTKI